MLAIMLYRSAAGGEGGSCCNRGGASCIRDHVLGIHVVSHNKSQEGNMPSGAGRVNVCHMSKRGHPQTPYPVGLGPSALRLVSLVS